jgi:hypothetical protein
MAVQSESNNSTVPFILSGISFVSEAETLLTDAGRATPLVHGTLMAKVAASGKWVPFTDETAVNGTAIPQGIFIGSDIAAADLVAGDVVDQPILEGGALTIDVQQLVIENSKLLTTVITVGTTDLRTVRDHLMNKGIFTESTVDITGFENA